MKLILENWQQYLNEKRRGWETIPPNSIVQVWEDDSLYYFSQGSFGRYRFVPLNQVDLSRTSGLSNAEVWTMKGNQMYEEDRRDSNWIRVVADPEKTRKILKQFEVFGGGGPIASSYDVFPRELTIRGIKGYDDPQGRIPRYHSVEVDIENLKVTLK